MNYTVELKPRAIKDLKSLQNKDSSRIADGLEELQSGLTGDVKKLTNFTPEYRLRIGSFRCYLKSKTKTELSSIVCCITAMPTGSLGDCQMILLHPSILECDGKKAFAVLPYTEFVRLEEELHDFEDLKDLRAAKTEEGAVAATSLVSVRKKLKI